MDRRPVNGKHHHSPNPQRPVLVTLTRSATISQVLPEPDPNNHLVQCKCDLQHMGYLTKKYHTIFRQAKRQSCAQAQLWLSFCSIPKHAAGVYRDLKNSSIESKQVQESIRQIELDLSRTYPDEDYFSGESMGREVLSRLLKAFSLYDPSLGYVQGMNFIAASLLWHASEVDAFWIFVSLMEDFELRDNYIHQLPGLSKHCQIINLLLFEHLPRLHLHFSEHRIVAEMFATDWCFTLFGSLVPVSEMGFCISKFIQKGWLFFYKVVVIILSRLEDRLLLTSDISEILGTLKTAQKSQKHWREFVSLLEQGGEKLNWQKLFEESEYVEIDEDYIKQLHFNFSLDTARFRTVAQS